MACYSRVCSLRQMHLSCKKKLVSEACHETYLEPRNLIPRIPSEFRRSTMVHATQWIPKLVKTCVLLPIGVNSQFYKCVLCIDWAVFRIMLLLLQEI